MRVKLPPVLKVRESVLAAPGELGEGIGVVVAAPFPVRLRMRGVCRPPRGARWRLWGSFRPKPAWGRGEVPVLFGTPHRQGPAVLLPCGTTRRRDQRGSQPLLAHPVCQRLVPYVPFQETFLVLLHLPVLLLVLQLPLQLPLAPRRWLPPLQPLLPLPQPPVLALPQPQPPLLGRGLAGQPAPLQILFPRPGVPLQLPPPLQVSSALGSPGFCPFRPSSLTGLLHGGFPRRLVALLLSRRQRYRPLCHPPLRRAHMSLPLPSARCSSPCQTGPSLLLGDPHWSPYP